MTHKRYSAWKWSGALLLVLAAVSLGGWELSQELAGRGLINHSPMRNFGVVWDHKLTRSGLPYGDAGWEWLKQQGVHSVVTFREENDVDYAKFGFQDVLHLPWSGYREPTEEQVETYLKFIQDPSNQPVHIHCSAGKSRTSLMAALARYAIDGWPLDRALAEAKLYRSGEDMSPHLITWLRNWAAQHPPGSFRVKN
jgi:hypothetical protein